MLPQPPDTAMLAHLFGTLSSMLDGQGTAYVISAHRLMVYLIPIEVVFLGLWMALDGNSAIQRALTAVVRFGLFYWMVFGWTRLMTAVIAGFEQAGSRLSGGRADTGALLELARRILDAGALASHELLTTINQLSVDSTRNSGEISLLVLCYALAMGGFFLAAVQILLVSVEFLVISVLGVLLLPFGVFARTAFLAENTLRAVVVLGVRKMAMVFMVLALDPQYGDYAYPAGLQATDAGAIPMAFNLMFWALAIGLLVWRVPLHLSALMSKAPSLFPPPALSGSGIQGAPASIGADAGFGASSLSGLRPPPDSEATRAAAAALQPGQTGADPPSVRDPPDRLARIQQRMAARLKP